jgi:hypothetical protein
MEAAVSSETLVNIYRPEYLYVTECNYVYYIKINRRFEEILLADCFMPVACMSYSSSLEMKATYPSETSVDFKRTSWHYIPEDIYKPPQPPM